MCERAPASRAEGTVPDDVCSCFAGKEDHPLYQFLAQNPDQVVNSGLAITVADGAASPVEIIAACSHKGKSGYYMKAAARITMGGIQRAYLTDRKLLMAKIYLNNEGMRVFAVPNQTLGPSVAIHDDDVDVYDQVTGSNKRSNDDDEDVYNEALPAAKVAKV